MSDDRLWTVLEVAAYLHVTRVTVFRLPIRYSKIGKARRYDPADVKLYVQLNSSRSALKSA